MLRRRTPIGWQEPLRGREEHIPREIVEMLNTGPIGRVAHSPFSLLRFLPDVVVYIRPEFLMSFGFGYPVDQSLSLHLLPVDSREEGMSLNRLKSYPILGG